MRKTVTVLVDVQAEITENITCNKCGISQIVPEHKNELPVTVTNQFHEFQIQFGYGSRHDGDVWKFDLCESCLEKFKGGFAIKIA